MLEKDYKIVLLVPNFKIIYFDRYKSENIIIEGIVPKLSRRDLFFRNVFLWLLSTRTIDIKNQSKLAETGNYLNFALHRIVSVVLARFSFPHKIFRLIDSFLSERPLFDDLLSKYKPVLIFSTDFQNELEVILLKAAKKNRIKNLAMVRSWDNITSKGVPRVLPDKFIVNNDLIKNELQEFDFIEPSVISVIGIPHYDRYKTFQPESKESFFRSCGFDLSKKLIVYAPIGDRYISPNTIDEKVVAILSTLNENVLVRLPPTDTVQSLSGKSFGNNVFFEYTGGRSWKSRWGKEGAKVNEISEKDDDRLITTLRCADVLVAGPTTMIIDAAIFDIPVVLVDFEGEEDRKYALGVRRYYDYNHFNYIRQSGGVRFAQTPSELFRLVRRYCSDRTIDSKGRKKIVDGECYLLDMHSTERLYDVIRNSL